MWNYQDTECTSEDMGRKFNGSWVNLDKIGIAQIDSFDDDGFYTRLDDGNEKYYKRSEFKIISEYPDVGQMVNIRGTAHYILRTPRRQWIAGLTIDTLSSECPTTGKAIGRLTRETVNSLFHPEYVPLDIAYNAVIKKVGISMAFTPLYWLINMDGKSVQLWRRAVEVGTIIKNDDIYSINIHDFSMSLTQELKDDLKNAKYTIS
jgi:hypothetical protein